MRLANMRFTRWILSSGSSRRNNQTWNSAGTLRSLHVFSVPAAYLCSRFPKKPIGSWTPLRPYACRCENRTSHYTTSNVQDNNKLTKYKVTIQAYYESEAYILRERAERWESKGRNRSPGQGVIYAYRTTAKMRKGSPEEIDRIILRILSSKKRIPCCSLRWALPSAEKKETPVYPGRGGGVAHWD